MHPDPDPREVEALSIEGPAVGGLAHDTVICPVVALAAAAVVGGAAGLALPAILATLGVAVGLLGAVVVTVRDDLVGRAVDRYARGTVDRLARLAAALVATVLWGGALLVGLAIQ